VPSTVDVGGAGVGAFIADRCGSGAVGKRYKNVDELRAAVRAECLAEWRKVSSEEWCDRWARIFVDPVLTGRDKEAQEIAAEVLRGFRRLQALYAKGRRPVPHAATLDDIADAYVWGREFKPGERAFESSLMRFLKTCAYPGLGWETASIPVRVVTLLRHRERPLYAEFGLKIAPDDQTMAIFALLVGHFPKRTVASLTEQHGATVYEVKAAVEKSIWTERKRLEAMPTVASLAMAKSTHN
jgi:hypothetical protein